jgi:hypothetical protein
VGETWVLGGLGLIYIKNVAAHVGEETRAGGVLRRDSRLYCGIDGTELGDLRLHTSTQSRLCRLGRALMEKPGSHGPERHPWQTREGATASHIVVYHRDLIRVDCAL